MNRVDLPERIAARVAKLSMPSTSKSIAGYFCINEQSARVILRKLAADGRVFLAWTDKRRHYYIGGKQ